MRLRERVSVLIPTLDAGPGLAETLDAVTGQSGVRLHEVLVTDSGSTDGTPELARERGARVRSIASEEFDHGRTRDELAERAGGDVLVMLVQDAVLAHPRVLRELVLALRRDRRLAAVSAWPLHRPDADLHTRWEVWNRARSLRASGAAPARRRRLERARPAERAASKRERRLARAALDDVCAAIRRPAWAQVRFRPTEFAEDLDFALRAVELGWRSRFVPEAPVVHSHDRGAAYLFSRHAVSVWRTAELLGERRRRSAPGGIEGAAGAIRSTLRDLEGAVRVTTGEDPGAALPLSALTSRVAEGLRKGVEPLAPTAGLAELDRFLEPSAPERSGGEPERERLATAFEWPPLAEFASSCPEPLPPQAAHRFVALMAAARLGQTMARPLREEPDSAIGRRLRVQVGARLT